MLDGTKIFFFGKGLLEAGDWAVGRVSHQESLDCVSGSGCLVEQLSSQLRVNVEEKLRRVDYLFGALNWKGLTLV